MNKRGTHVGVVISFVVFIIFLLAIYAIIKPVLTKQKDKELLLNNLQGEVIGKISDDLISTTLLLDVVPGSPIECVYLTNFFPETNLSQKIIVKDKDSNLINAAISGQNLVLFDFDSKFFKVYQSENFDEIAEGNCDFEETFNLGLARKSKTVFEEKIVSFLGDYSQDYESLKIEFNIPGDSGFEFSFTLSNKTILKTQERNLSTGVYSSQFQTIYFSKDANLSLGYLNLRVW